MKFFSKICIFFFFGILALTRCKSDQKAENELTNSNKIDSVTQQEILITSVFEKDGDAFIVPWKYLMSVKFEEQYNEKMGMEVSLPIFSDTLKMLDGKRVQVDGFYIPVDETGNEKIVILSAYPFAQCFFCGKAGVESIIDILSPKKLPVLKVDTKIKFRGRLKLNRDNFDYLIYVLEEAEMVK
jgi:hypothetical protein